MEIKKLFQYRIGIFGPPKVGKTAIASQLVHKNLGNNTPTTENDIEYITSYDDSTYICLLTETTVVMRRFTIEKM